MKFKLRLHKLDQRLPWVNDEAKLSITVWGEWSILNRISNWLMDALKKGMTVGEKKEDAK